MRDRLCWWYLNWCVRRGRIIAGIPEGCLKAEILRNTDRLSVLFSIGTAAAAKVPEVPTTRQEILRVAFDTGFVVQRSPRIAWGAVIEIEDDQWAADELYDIGARQARESKFVRAFDNYPLEALKDYGERLAIAHSLAGMPQYAHLAHAAYLTNITLERYLWRDGLMAEENAPVAESSQEAFLKKVRGMLADWVDFDVAAVHYGYGYDVLCSEDRGREASSIFAAAHAAKVAQFGVRVVNILGLTKLCLRRFWFPLLGWT